MPTSELRTIKHMVTFWLPGSFFSEDTAAEIPERTIAAAVAVAPDAAYAFQFFDSPVVDFEFDAERFAVLPVPQNKSGTYYLGGQVYTLDEVKGMLPAENTLIGNMEGNGWPVVIKSPNGRWFPFEPGDQLVPMTEPVTDARL